MTQALPHKIGSWSSLLFAILGLVLIAANIGIGFSGQWRAWEGMENYAAWHASVRIIIIACIASFLMIILFLRIMAVLHSLAPDEKKTLGMPGISLTVIWITLVSIAYYTHGCSLRLAPRTSSRFAFLQSGNGADHFYIIHPVDHLPSPTGEKLGLKSEA